MLQRFNLQVEMSVITCVSCGVPFAFPSAFFADTVRIGGTIRCPRGHHNVWDEPRTTGDGKSSPEAVELRRELLRAVHRAEQAEARAAAEMELNDRQTAAAGAVAPAVAPGPCKCPKCGKSYKVRNWLERHLRRAHGLEGEAAR